MLRSRKYKRMSIKKGQDVVYWIATRHKGSGQNRRAKVHGMISERKQGSSEEGERGKRRSWSGVS
jgi:hypothetical protein